MIEIDGVWLLPQFKERCVAPLGKGEAVDVSTSNRMAKRPLAVLLVALLMGGLALFSLAVFSIDQGLPLSMAARDVAFEISLLAAAFLLWFRPRLKLTYLAAAAGLLIFVVSGVFQYVDLIIWIVKHWHIEAARVLIRPGDIVLKGCMTLAWCVLAYRFCFGRPSRTYYGFIHPSEAGPPHSPHTEK